MISQNLSRNRVGMLAALLFVTTLSQLSAVDITNGQKMYRYGSPEYEAIRTLYIEQRLGLPFSSGPFSEAELRLALERLDPDELSEPGLELYRWVTARFEKEPDYVEEEGNFAFDAGAEINLESYVHTDSDNPFWEYKWEDRKPLLNFPLEAWVTDHAYGVMELDFGKGIPDFSLYPTYDSGGQILDATNDGDPFFDTVEEDPFTNVWYDPLTLNVQFPHRAYISFGGDRWNLQVGRDALDWGNGRTGNLYISGYSAPHDYARLSTFWRNFKFSALWLSLDPHIVSSEREFVNYTYDADFDGEAEDEDDISVYEPDKEEKNLIAHRFEVRLWNRLTLAATEGIIFGRDRVELRHFNPLYLYHNLYTNTRNVGNTHMSYEFDLAITPGLNLYAAISPDQWTSPLEDTDLSDEPNAIIYLAGLDYRQPLAKGFFSGTLEGIYSTKWMYIHNHPLTSITVRRYVQAEHGVGRSGVYYDRPMGHYGGNDFALLWLDLNYQRVNRYRYGLTTYYEVDGENPINALLSSTYDERRALTEAEAEEQAPSGSDPQHKVVATVYGEVQPWFWEGFNEEEEPSLSISSEVSFQFMQNRFASVLPEDTQLDFAHDWKFDLQWVLSVSLGW
ncbi:MAG: hypothetical protein ACLFQZ_07095 [Spirochaetaceae bacterium]